VKSYKTIKIVNNNMQNLTFRQYQKPTSTLETLFEDVEADLDSTLDQLTNQLEKLDEQGYGYQYKSYTCEAGYTHDELIDGSAKPEYVEIEEAILEIQLFIQSQKNLLKTINKYV
jgi:hypothetical protein